MKVINQSISIILVAALLGACSTTEKFSVKAPVGTAVYTPNNTLTPKKVITSADARNEINVTSDTFYGYMLVKPENSSVQIPLGIDFHSENHTMTKTALYSAVGLELIGLTSLFCGTIMVLAEGDDDTSTASLVAVGGGAAASLMGLGIGMPAQSRLRQTAYDYNFAYDKKQTFVVPLLSSKLLHPNPSKVDLNKPVSVKPERKKASSGTSTKDVSTKSNQGSKSKKSKTDVATKISGVYEGTGVLYLDKEMEDSYDDIIVQISKVDKDHVDLIIIENGEEFFETPLRFNVKKNKNGTYSLTMDNVKGAKVTLTKDGKLTFSHPMVIIEDETYTLNLTSAKVNN